MLTTVGEVVHTMKRGGQESFLDVASLLLTSVSSLGAGVWYFWDKIFNNPCLDTVRNLTKSVCRDLIQDEEDVDTKLNKEYKSWKAEKMCATYKLKFLQLGDREELFKNRVLKYVYPMARFLAHGRKNIILTDTDIKEFLVHFVDHVKRGGDPINYKKYNTMYRARVKDYDIDNPIEAMDVLKYCVEEYAMEMPGWFDRAKGWLSLHKTESYNAFATIKDFFMKVYTWIWNYIKKGATAIGNTIGNMIGNGICNTIKERVPFASVVIREEDEDTDIGTVSGEQALILTEREEVTQRVIEKVYSLPNLWRRIGFDWIRCMEPSVPERYGTLDQEKLEEQLKHFFVDTVRIKVVTLRLPVIIFKQKITVWKIWMSRFITLQETSDTEAVSDDMTIRICWVEDQVILVVKAIQERLLVVLSKIEEEDATICDVFFSGIAGEKLASEIVHRLSEVEFGGDAIINMSEKVYLQEKEIIDLRLPPQVKGALHNLATYNCVNQNRFYRQLLNF